MIVTCDACQTNFTVDDSRIPEKGIRVRCSKCKHIFMVKRETPKESVSEFDEFERFHRGQLEGEAPGAEDGVSAAEERPARIPDEPAPDLSFEEFLKKQESVFGPQEAGLPAEEELPEGFGEIKDQAEEVAEALAPGFSPAPEPERPEAMEGALGGEAEEEETKLSAEAFFKEEMEREAAQQRKERSLPSVKDKRLEDLMRGKRARKGQTERRSSFRMILLLILLILVGGVAYFYWQNQGISMGSLEEILPALKTGAAKVSALWDEVLGSRGGALELSGLEGNEEKIGQHRLYVIKGNVTNNSGRARKYVKLRVIILDQAGNQIKEKIVLCGNVFTREELEKLSERFFTGDEVLQPKRPADMVVEAHQTISFMAIFSGLPREGKSFKVEKLEAPAA